MDPGLAIFFGAIAATFGWFATVRNNRVSVRRQHTYQTITRQSDDKRYEEALVRIRDILTVNDIPAPDSKLRQDDIDKLDYFMNHYEFLAAAILCGDIDERLIRACEYSRMTKLYRKMEDYIIKSREFRGQPTMYENLQFIVDRWEANGRTRAQALVEFFTLRPCRTLPAPLRELDRWIS